MNKDMCVACDDGILNIRVGAIIMKDGKILMVDDEIPPTSIVREFIGGNSFYK